MSGLRVGHAEFRFLAIGGAARASQDATMLGSIIRAGSLVGVTVPWSVAAAVVAPIAQGRLLKPVSKLWANQLLMTCGVKVEAFGPPEPLDPNGAYLVMSNHTSHFDVPSIYSVAPIDMRPVAKQELAAIPFFGWALKRGAAILIDRRDKERAYQSINEAAQTIREGRSVLMFPEGTRTPTEELGALKKGAFYLALAARVPVVPVAVLGTKAVLPAGGWRIMPGRVQVRFGRPIDTIDLPDGEAGREQLMDQLRAAIAELVREGREHDRLRT